MAPSGAQQAFFRQGATPAQPKRKPQDRPGRKAAQRSHPHARRSRSRRLPGALAATLWDLHQSAALMHPVHARRVAAEREGRGASHPAARIVASRDLQPRRAHVLGNGDAHDRSRTRPA